MWALRGAPLPDMGSTEGELKDLAGDLVQVTSANAPILGTFVNMRVLIVLVHDTIAMPLSDYWGVPAIARRSYCISPL